MEGYSATPTKMISFFKFQLFNILLVLLPLTSSLQENWHFSGKNIAFNRSTSQGPGTRLGGVSSRAVDGNTDTDWSGKSCTHTNMPTRKAFWNVSFEESFNVSGIKIFNRNKLKERLKNFKVFGIHQNAQKTLIYDDKQFNNYNNETILIEVNGTEIYIGIKITTPDILTLCEVQVYAVKCKAFSRENNTVVVPDKEFYPENSTVTISCVTNYELDSHFNSTSCGVGGWNRLIPVCRPTTCNVPESPENGHYSWTRNQTTIYNSSHVFYVDNIIVGQCDVGYEGDSGAYQRICQSDKTWSGNEIKCEFITCPLPGPISNGNFNLDNSSIIHPDRVKYGTIINVTCNTGYILEDDSARTCNYGTIINVTCNTGYILEDDSARTCNLTHEWTGTEPECITVKCNYPENIPNGFYSVVSNRSTESINYTSGELKYSTEIRVHCIIGNYLHIGDEVRQCLVPDVWSGDEPVCAPIICKWPLHLEGGYYVPSDNSSTEGLPYGTLLRAACFETFELSNNFTTRRCNENRVWDQEPAVCSAISRPADHIKIIGSVSAGIIIALAAGIFLVLYFTRRLHPRGDALRKHFKVDKEDDQHTIFFSEIHNVQMPDNSEVSVEGHGGHVYSNVAFIESAKLCDDFTGIDASEGTYYNVEVPKTPKPMTAIYVKDLTELMLSGDCTEKFKKQFEALPKGMTEKHSEAVNPINIGKNRYKNLYAYDASRVVLDKDDSADSDYINACYVDGYSKDRKYIASQGPTKEILVDFWRMIWQSDSNKIVMLTRLIEEATFKCEQYWPDDGSISYGRVTVTLKNSETYSNYAVRTLTVRKDNKKREVKQFHFIAWSDKGVPMYSSSLIRFLQKVNDMVPHAKGHIIVHCSAGVGRTGTYIALDYLHEQGRSLGYVDVAGTLKTLRKQRVNLVQTLDQYIFLYRSLAELFMLSTKTLSIPEFPQFYKELQKTSATGKSKLAIEFETLRRMHGRHLPKGKRLDYENACDVKTVNIPSSKDKRAFIVTKSPSNEDRADFWNRVWYNDVLTVVLINNKAETKEKHRPQDNSIVLFGNIKVTVKNSDKNGEHHIHTYSVQNKDVVREIKQFEIGGWKKDKSVPGSPYTILSLVELVRSWQQQTGNHSILVHYKDGFDKSGLFCVVYALIEHMKTEQEVAILHVMDDMRSACRQIAPSPEQYQFCHETVLASIQQNDTYSNFRT